METSELQELVKRRHDQLYGTTDFDERLRDLQHQVTELAYAKHPHEVTKEIGDVGWALLQLANETGNSFEEAVQATLTVLASRQTRRRKVGLIGTSANPITNAHITLGLELLALTDLDEVWYLLVGTHPWGKTLMPAGHRLQMAEMAVSKYNRLKVCDFEIAHALRLKDVHETAFMLRDHLLPAFPDTEFSWVMGSDVAQTFHKWEGARWMADTIRLIVVHRDGYPGESDFLFPSNRHLFLKDIATSNVSSTLVRSRGTPEKMLALVPKEVAIYLQEHKLLGAP